MTAITHLVIKDVLKHRIRAGLTVAAIALAVSLVVAMTSGFESVRAAAGKLLGAYYDDVDLIIRPDDERGEWIDRSVVDALKADARVADVRATLTTRSPALDPGRKTGKKESGRRPAQLVGATGPTRSGAGSDLVAGAWFENRPLPVAVVEEPIAKQFELEVGDELVLPSPTESLTLKVVGIVKRPGMMRIDPPAIYLPLGTLQSWLGRIGKVNRIEVDLKNPRQRDAFVEEWTKQSAERKAPLTIKTVESETGKLDASLQGLKIITYMGGTVSMVAAMFIVFSALSMGVAERTRIMAMLRAIGATKRQVAQVVIVEAALLSAVAAPTGVALGWTWITLLAWWKPHLFSGGAQLSIGGTVYGLLGSTLSALAASLIPAWSASRVDVLEAMGSLARPASRRWALAAGVGGAMMLAVDPLIAFASIEDKTVQLYLHLFVGLPSLMLGLFGIAPVLVIVLEKLAGGAVARVMGIEPALLRQQLSGGLWRTAGTAAGLMVGLAALVAMQTHGQSVLSGFRLPTKFPDMLLFAPFGLDDKQIATIRHMEGVAQPGVMPVALASPQLGTEMFDIGGAVKMPEATIMFGLDVEQAFGNEEVEGIVGLDFVEGDEATARKLLKEGRYVVVSDQFRSIKGIGLGDKLKLKTPLNGEVEYTIAGVAKATGVEVLVRIFDMRQEFERWTAAAVVASLETLREDFGSGRVHMFAANIDPSGERAAMEEKIKQQVGAWGLMSADARQIKVWADQMLQRLLNLMSTVAVAAIGVASLGVTNTVMAGVRTRRWQFGVLRSMGLTRASLLRLVLAESLLIGLVGAALGLTGGVLMGVDANELSGKITGFFPPFVLPIETLLLGVGITMAVATIASLWPALSVARSDTLNLLKSGRAST